MSYMKYFYERSMSDFYPFSSNHSSEVVIAGKSLMTMG